jgi:hypothetical protein
VRCIESTTLFIPVIVRNPSIGELKQTTPMAAADRISELPDPILSHILSFLPTKLAATTSILSKRWKSVWHSVLTLDFDDETFKDFHSLTSFMSSTMSSRDTKLPIHSFTFKCAMESSPYDLKDLNQYVILAVQ